MILLKFVPLHNGEPIAPFIFRVSRMTLDPDELHAVDFKQIKELFPKVGVKGGLFI